MKILLRIIAVVVGIGVLETLLMFFQFASTSRLGLLIGSGVFGIITVSAWSLILVAGPVASVQLWRLRLIGLYGVASLCALVLLYYLVGYAFYRGPGLQLARFMTAVLGNSVLVALLLSPNARRVCS